MDTYSYISENGTVRQIEDLLAKAKNEEQDEKILALEQAVGRESYEFGEKLTGKTWMDGKPIYRYCGYRSGVNPTQGLVVLTSDIKSADVNSVVAVGGSCVVDGNNFQPLTGYTGSTNRTALILNTQGICFLSSGYVYTKLYYFVEYTKV